MEAKSKKQISVLNMSAMFTERGGMKISFVFGYRMEPL